jgi:hypothetical protein
MMRTSATRREAGTYLLLLGRRGVASAAHVGCQNSSRACKSAVFEDATGVLAPHTPIRTRTAEVHQRWRRRSVRNWSETAFFDPYTPGLHGGEVTEFLWDNQIAAVAADNSALEATRAGDSAPLALHVGLIARLGMPLGELWLLDAPAADCAADGVYNTMIVSAPLNVRGGAGSPANALALK